MTGSKNTPLFICFLFITMLSACASHKKTILCLGSGRTPLFKENTLQAMALPVGSEMQFRYGKQLISPSSLGQDLESDSLTGASVLLGYDDYNRLDTEGYGYVVPLRYGKLIDSARVGSVFILRFELEGFAVGEDLDSLQQHLPRQRRHRSTANGEGDGALCLELSDGFAMPRRSTDIDYWETTVGELVKHDDFKHQTYFFNILGIFVRGSNTAVALKNGECLLHPDKDYELRLVYKDPKWGYDHQEVQWLKLDGSDPWLKVQTLPLPVDSPYDVAPVQLRTTDPGLRSQHGLLAIRDRDDVPMSTQNDSRLPVDLSIPVEVGGTLFKTLEYGAILGIVMAFQQLLVVYSSKELRPRKWPTRFAVVLGLATGFILAFGLTKP